MDQKDIERKPFAPLVIPMAANVGSFTNIASRANQVSENKCRREMDRMDAQQHEVLTKMAKEMNELKYVLSLIKPKRNKRQAIKEQGRNSPQAKYTKVLLRDNSVNDDIEQDMSYTYPPRCEKRRQSLTGLNSEEKTDTVRSLSARAKTTVVTKAERDAEDRITNLHRRYMLAQGTFLRSNTAVSRHLAAVR